MNDLHLTLHFTNGLLIGGQSPAIAADTATARDAGGVPMLPASAVKGALRMAFERLLDGLHEPACHPQQQASGCTETTPCRVCLVFGSAESEAQLRFEDAVIGDEATRALFSYQEQAASPQKPTGAGYALRHGVAINRRRRTAEDGLLFLSETAPALPLTFTARLEWQPGADLRGDALETLRRLRAAAASLTTLGADASRGLGWLDATLEETVPPPAARRHTAPAPAGNYARAAPGQAAPPAPFTDFQLTLIPVEYVRVSDVKVSNNFMDTLDYLPGGTVRGALARVLADLAAVPGADGWQSAAMRAALLQTPLRVSNFYIADGQTPGLRYPVPLSARTCKRYPGLNEEAAKESHGSKDILIAATLAALLSGPAPDGPGLPVALMDVCGHKDGNGNACENALAPLAGYVYDPFVPAANDSIRVGNRLVTKTALNRSRRTSADQQLYSYEAMDPRLAHASMQGRVQFVGVVRNVPAATVPLLCRITSLTIGGARERGYGKVSVQCAALPANDAAGAEMKKARNKFEFDLKKFSECITAPLKAGGHPKHGRLFFALTLTSALMPPPGEGLDWLTRELETQLDLTLNLLTREQAFTRTVFAGGFHQALKLYKEPGVALAMGSAFVFSCEAKPGDVAEPMVAVQRDGLGRRREEGFGQVRFCHPYHTLRITQA